MRSFFYYNTRLFFISILMERLEQIYTYILNSKISTDSRLVNKGDIFFALKGENFNGNRFASKDIEKGAEIAIVDDPEFK